MEEEDVGVDENDFVVFGELPETKLTIVVLKIGAVFYVRVSDPFNVVDLPPGGGKSVAFGGRDEIVQEEDEVAFGAILE